MTHSATLKAWLGFTSSANSSLTDAVTTDIAGSSYTCVDSASKPAPVPSTTLTLFASTTGTTAATIVPALSATCYEANFATASLPVGRHTALVTTPWGESTRFGLTVLSAATNPTSPPTMVHVDADFNGSIQNALAHATSLPTAAKKVVVLSGGKRVYTLDTGIQIPPNTTLVGAGADESTIEFSVVHVCCSHFRLKIALQDVISSHTCSLEAS
jgi:hypothetical protein